MARVNSRKMICSEQVETVTLLNVWMILTNPVTNYLPRWWRLSDVYLELWYSRDQGSPRVVCKHLDLRCAKVTGKFLNWTPLNVTVTRWHLLRIEMAPCIIIIIFTNRIPLGPWGRKKSRRTKEGWRRNHIYANPSISHIGWSSVWLPPSCSNWSEEVQD